VAPNAEPGIGRDFLEHIIGVAKSAACQIVYLEVRPSTWRRPSLSRARLPADRDPSEYYPPSPGRGCAVLGLAL